MFSRTARICATALVAMAVVLSMAVGPAIAAQEDGGLVEGDTTIGGDSGVTVGESGVSVGGDSGVDVGTDGVSVGGDEGINASTDGVSVAGQDAGTDTLSDGTSPSLPGTDDGPVSTDGSNLEVGGDEGVSAGTDGVSAGGDSGVSIGTDGVSVAGQDVEDDGLPGSDGLPGDDSLPGAGSGEVRDVPTGPVPIDISYSLKSVNEGVLMIDSADDAPQGAQLDIVLATGQREAGAQTLVSNLEASGADRTYLDFDGEGTASQNGLENADGAVYTVNESGGEYIVALSRDSLQTAGMGFAQGEQVGVVNAQNTPGTQQGTLAGGLNPANIFGQGPSAPVGPQPPEQLGGGITCNGEECLVGTSGAGEQVPENEYTKPLRESDPLPLTLDQSGVLLPCNKPVGADDLPADQLPGLSDLPKGTLPGVPTSLLTNDAVLGLAFGAAPAPCETTRPLADPVANPAAEPGETSPTFDADNGGLATDDGLHAVRLFEVGPGGNLGTADGISAVVLNEEQQAGVHEVDLSNSEYQYVLVDTRTEREDSVTNGDLEASLREDYAGIDTGFDSGPSTEEFSGEVTPSVLQKQIIELRLSCDSSGCQPSYSGLPSLGALPELPNPLAGDAGLPA